MGALPLHAFLAAWLLCLLLLAALLSVTWLLDSTWLLHLALLGHPTYHPISLLLDYTELLLAASLLLHLVCSLTRFYFHWAALPRLHLYISLPLGAALPSLFLQDIF